MILRALTIYQPWASLIAIGAKPYEFRKWPAPAYVIGARVVIHAAARPVRREEVLDVLQRCDGKDGPPPVIPEIAVPFLEGLMRIFDSTHSSQKPGRTMLPLSAGLCSAVLDVPVRAVDLHPADSDRVDHHIWAWPLTDVQVFEKPIEARGAQGFWTWGADIQREISR
jgi:hypothetical protein